MQGPPTRDISHVGRAPKCEISHLETPNPIRRWGPRALAPWRAMGLWMAQPRSARRRGSHRTEAGAGQDITPPLSWPARMAKKLTNHRTEPIAISVPHPRISRLGGRLPESLTLSFHTGTQGRCPSSQIPGESAGKSVRRSHRRKKQKSQRDCAD